MNVIIATGVGDFTMEVGSNEPVLEMKLRIQNHLGVPVANQSLSVYGIELVDGLDMDDYPLIYEGTRIELAVGSNPLLPEPPGKMLLTLKFSARMMNVEVDRNETVKALKEKIHIFENTSIKRITLLFSGIEMKEDHRYLCEYGICDQSEIGVIHRSTGGQRAEPTSRMVSFMVQTASCLLNAAIIPLEMKDTATVNDLRKVLLDEKILPRDDYFFIHKQRIMQDVCSLRWHGVEDSDFVYVFKGTISRQT